MLFDDNNPDPIDVADEESGEETVSGSNALPGSDADTGAMVAEVTGRDPDPNMDNPQELNTAKEIDDAEEDIQQS